MMHMGDIMSTVEGVQYRGGNSQLLFEYPTVLNTPTVLMISPHMHHDIPPRYSNFKGWYPPHGTHDIPHMHHDIPPRYSNFKGWYPPTVLNTLHGTHDIPPRASWYPSTVLMISPHGTHDIPHGTHDIPHSTEHPHGTQDIPPHLS